MSDIEKAVEILRREQEENAPIPETKGIVAESAASFEAALVKKLNEPIAFDTAKREQVLIDDFSKDSPPARVLDRKEPPSGEAKSNAAAERTVPTESGVVSQSANDEKEQSERQSKSQDRDLRKTGESEKVRNSLVLSFGALAQRGFITPGAAKGRLTEEYRRIKRPLLKNMAGATLQSHKNVVMVTSSLSGEGKTYTAINLAMSLSQEKERSVLLIDADVLKGTAGRELGAAESEPGLIGLLGQSFTSPDEVILQTNVPGLSFMPAGSVDDNANELLTSEQMREYVDQLARESAERIIILDCPPILQTNEAHALAEYAGQVVFVVAEQKTSQSHVVEALKHLDKDKYVGMLLNKSTNAGSTYGYGYGYN